MMQKVSDSTFTDVEQHLDGMHFERCKFIRCRLVYSGGQLPRLDNNHFDTCGWALGGAAGNAVEFLRALYASGGESVVEGVIARIRTPQMKSS